MSRVTVPRGAVELAIRQSGKFVKPKVEPSLVKEFKIMKEKMLSEFDNHPITIELEQKTSADPSAFVSSGSLFGFIGFEKESNPTEIVREMLEKSPTSLRLLKAALNADCDGQAGLQQLAGDATMLFYMSEEAQEGRDAFKEKRKPDFKKFKRYP